MKPETIGRQYNVGKIAAVQCVKNDTFKDSNIKDNCFWLIIIYDGKAQFQVGDITFEAEGPCFVCFDETQQPKLLKKRGLKCDSIYFHPTFLHMNMTFDMVRSLDYKEVAMSHDLFLLKPFTDERRYVYPLFWEYVEKLTELFNRLNDELREQYDWYWSCRSRSYFMEIILLLERTYGTICQSDSKGKSDKIRDPHLRSAVIFIEGNYHKNVTLEDITNAASLNHSTLTQLFKEELGVTPVEYLWQYRITVSKKHLEFTNLSVKEISLRCGFKTVQHFSRKFEEIVNSTPTAFRERAVAERKSVLY